MEFRTIIKPKSYGFNMSHDSKILLIGSCFSGNIGEKLFLSKFNTLINPFGILFNPISIGNSLLSIIERKRFAEHDLIKENGLYHSFLHHGKFSSLTSEEALKKINKSNAEAFDFLKNTSVLILTFGSAWVYRHKKTQKIVSNCHKIPSKEFNKELLEIEEILAFYKGVIAKIKKINPTIKIIFTISPVRHWKDGAVESNLSKSLLNVSVHKLVHSIENSFYFPAYEIIMDDLRDYRFYKEDMLHPNAFAINYVWRGFKKSFFTSETILLLEQIAKIRNAVNHKPLHLKSEKHQTFIQNQLKMIELVSKRHPNLNFELELNTFKAKIV